MFARMTWSQIDKSQIDASVNFIRDRVLPSLKTQSGFLGFVALGDRETGEGVSGSYWESAEAMAASDAMGSAGRMEVVQATRATITDVDRFEMLLQDRSAPVQAGTFVRINDLNAAKGQVDAAVAFVRDALPKIRSLDGYRAVLVFANRQTGRMILASSWETAAAREASESVIGGLRQEAFGVAQTQPSNVRISRFEGLLAEVSQSAQQSATAPAAR